jgi:hypothetical protein
MTLRPIHEIARFVIRYAPIAQSEEFEPYPDEFVERGKWYIVDTFGAVAAQGFSTRDSAEEECNRLNKLMEDKMK